jgi:pilus assembly protein Flp/PilA
MKKFMVKVAYYLTKKERGATAVEYALIVALIALAIILAVTAVGGGLNSAFENIATKIQAAVGS